jgi:L-cysteine S-thiosulfotransferase
MSMSSQAPNMKHKLISILTFFLLLASFAAEAGPAEDRNELLARYKRMLPTIKFEDYIHGALAMNPQAMEQYESVMDFPPFAYDLYQGHLHWIKPFNNGKTFATCFKDEGINAAASFPYYDDAAGRVVTFENAINDCLAANDEDELSYGSKEMALLTAFAKSLSDKEKINITISSAAALAAYEDGKQTYYRRQGQLNFACSTCHVDNAGKFIRSEQLSMMIGQASHWPEFRAGTEPVTLQARFMQCQKSIRAEPGEYNSTEYNNLEYFMTYMSNGLKMQTPVFRK